RQRRPGLPHPGDRHQGGALRARQAPPLGPLDGLLQAAALREVPAAARARERGDQARRRGRNEGGARRGQGRRAPRQDRRDRQDLLGDQAGLSSLLPEGDPLHAERWVPFVVLPSCRPTGASPASRTSAAAAPRGGRTTRFGTIGALTAASTLISAPGQLK